MNNEIGRKITSLTLMTIMLAGGMVIAAPSMMPVAHAANANLFVSAENSQFDNYMSGPQVIEVVVIDSDINDTSEAEGEPDVTVNGKDLRMVQAVDGNWYGYFADVDMATIADATTDVQGEGLDFGDVCTVAQGLAFIGISVSQTSGVAINTEDGACSDAAGFDVNSEEPLAINVVREAKDINTNSNTATKTNPNSVNPEAWPFIQLYDLNPTGNVVVQYNKGGGVQTTTLTFDTVDDFASASLDRASYTPGSEVHVTITDLWLNIDPTDEDSWTFGTIGDGSTGTTHYQVFNENGLAVGASEDNTDDELTDALDDLMCEDNCRLSTNADVQGKGFVITLQDNEDSEITVSAFDPTLDPQDPRSWGVENTINLDVDDVSGLGVVPVTITEQGPNSGVFGTYDESDTSNIVITNGANRGTSASIDYNETPVTILVGLTAGSIDIMPIDDEWSSGEEIPIELFDNDANKNSRADEDLNLNDPNVDLIPSLETGDPLTLDDATLINFDFVDADGVEQSVKVLGEVQSFSDRAILSGASVTVSDDTVLRLNIGDYDDFFDAAPVNDADFHGFALFNYDIRSISDNLPDLDTFEIKINGVDILDNQQKITKTSSY